MRYDAIVVGAGPAGATAARELARAGRRVLLLERARLPRHKPCGGALSPRILRHLPAGLEPSLMEATITRATFTFHARGAVEFASERPLGFMVRRDMFDAALCQAAGRAGARLMDGTAARRVTLGAGGAAVETGAGTFTGDIVVGADGAAGVVARSVLSARRPPSLVAVESLVPLVADGMEGARDRIVVAFGGFPGGYAWAFPKRDHLNIGAMLRREAGARLKAAFQAFRRAAPGVEGAAGAVEGALVPAYDGALGLVAGGRAFLVGDAAGLVDPFLGEGIFFAVRSGQLLAAALARAGDDLEAAGAGYRAALAAEMEPEFRAALALSRLIHGFPRVWYSLLAVSNRFLEAYGDVLRGESTYAALLARIRDRAAAHLGPILARRVVSKVAAGS